jgi:hypothetical protein
MRGESYEDDAEETATNTGKIDGMDAAMNNSYAPFLDGRTSEQTADWLESYIDSHYSIAAMERQGVGQLVEHIKCSAGGALWVGEEFAEMALALLYYRYETNNLQPRILHGCLQLLGSSPITEKHRHDACNLLAGMLIDRVCFKDPQIHTALLAAMIMQWDPGYIDIKQHRLVRAIKQVIGQTEYIYKGLYLLYLVSPREAARKLPFVLRRYGPDTLRRCLRSFRDQAKLERNTDLVQVLEASIRMNTLKLV